MKKIIPICALIAAFTILSSDALGMQPINRPVKQHHKKHGSVGAPLDGGLLAVLGAAGIAYIAARKKKKNSGE